MKMNAIQERLYMSSVQFLDCISCHRGTEAHNLFWVTTYTTERFMICTWSLRSIITICYTSPSVYLISAQLWSICTSVTIIFGLAGEIQFICRNFQAALLLKRQRTGQRSLKSYSGMLIVRRLKKWIAFQQSFCYAMLMLSRRLLVTSLRTWLIKCQFQSCRIIVFHRYTSKTYSFFAIFCYITTGRIDFDAQRLKFFGNSLA